MTCDELDSACDVDRYSCGEEGDYCEPSPAVIVLFCLKVLIIVIAFIVFVMLRLWHLFLV